MLALLNLQEEHGQISCTGTSLVIVRANEKNVGFAHTVGENVAEPVAELREYLPSMQSKINHKGKQGILGPDEEMMMEVILMMPRQINQIAFHTMYGRPSKHYTTSRCLFVSFNAEEI